MATPTGERTEKPSAKRLKDARERGQVARSRDLTSAVSLVVVTLTLGWFGARMVGLLHDRLVLALSSFGDHARGTIESSSLVALLWSDGALIARIVGPPALVAGLASVVISVVQTGGAYSPKAIQINWGRLNPATGLGRLTPGFAGGELLKALLGIGAVGGVSYVLIREFYDRAPFLMSVMPAEVVRLGSSYLWTLLWRTSLALLVLGGADYAWQRWRWLSQLKMSRQEVREEAKLNEGSPEIKARVRRIQREMTKRRMLHAVKRATVVVTNPTHFAVALEYRRADMPAPIVVAKGQDHLAARIRAAAREHGVPIVENVTLARALYQTAEIGDAIPANLFSAVAEVLAYLVRLKQLVL
jgi:flagellar biosynthesis protein FlhB